MTARADRLYASDIARVRGVSVQRARQILVELEKTSPRAVGRDGRQRFTTRAAIERLHEPVGDERVDQLAELVEAVRADGQATSDGLDSLARQMEAFGKRLDAVERRV
jgi:hypothetical protein